MGATQEYVEDLLEKQRKARLEAANQQQHDPDESARVFGVQAVTNLPPEVVRADLPNLEKQLAADEFDYSDYTDQINGAPAFNRFVAENPFHLSVMQRDHKELPRLERAYRQMSLGWRSGWAMTEIAEIRDRQLTDFENPDNAADKAKLDELHQILEGGMFGASGFGKFLTGTAQQAPIMAWLTGEALDEIAIGAGVGAARGAFLGGVPGIGVGAITGIGIGARAGFAEAAFRLERGLAYDEYIGMGLDEEQARWASTAVGGVNAALESLGFGALTKRIPGINKILNDRIGGVINSVLVRPTMRNAFARATLQYGEGVATEILTEIMQEATLIVGGEYLKSSAREEGDIRPETEAMTSGEFWDQVGEIAAHTMYGVALIGGAGPMSSLIRDGSRANHARKYGAALDALGDAAEKSETRKNAPTKYEEFVNRLTGKDGKILIEARRFIDYFQEQGMDADEVAQSLGVKDLGEAEIGGRDIEIPAGQYLAKIAATPHHRGLKNDLKNSPNQMSVNEGVIHNNNVKKTIEEIRELAASQDPEQARIDAKLIEQVKAKLIGAGTSPEAAENQAVIMVGIPNLARRAGKDPEQFFRERFGGIVATTNAQMRADKEDVDLFVDPYLDLIRAGDLPNQRDIFGPSLIDTLKARGGLAMDAELDARDIKLSFRGLIKEGGDTLDGAAEIAHEAGFIAERDPEMLLAAIEREAGGELVFGTQHKLDSDKQELLGTLEQLADILDKAGIDISNMSNVQVRDAMKALDTFFQADKELDTSKLEELTEFIFSVAEHDPAMLARAAASLPALAETQDFGDVEFTDNVTIAGKPATRIRAANREFEIAKKRKNVLQALKDCLGG